MEQSHSSPSFNPANLYYSSPSELPEAQGLSCISCAMPIERASSDDLLIRHAQIYLKATEHLFRDLSAPLSPDETARFGKQFLNNVTVAHEIQNALLENLAHKIQATYARLERGLRSLPEEPVEEGVSIHIPTAYPVSSNPPQSWRQWLTQKAKSRIKTTPSSIPSHAAPSQPLPLASAPPPSQSSAVQNSPVAPPSSNPLTAPPPSSSHTPMPQYDDLPATHAYQHLVIERLESLVNTLKTQTEPAAQYATLREMELLYRTMQDSFQELQAEQRAQWSGLLDLIKGLSKDHVEADEKGPKAGSRVLFRGDAHDPRTELLFLERLKQQGLNVYNVPGDDHCALYSVFKDPHVLPVLRSFSPLPAGAAPESPSDLLKQDIRLARHLIADRVQEMLSHADENVRLAKRWELTENIKATRAFARKHGYPYPGDAATEEQYKNLEECYWEEFKNGRITLSDYHLSALSTILERPILVYSADYLPDAFVRHHLLEPQEAGKPLPRGVKPFTECFQEIPVPPEFAGRLDRAHPIYLYHSHGHYQAMTQSRY